MTDLDKLGNGDNLVGKKFEKLTCLEFAGRTPYHHLKWKWRCECGREKIITGNAVKYGGIKGCGICTKRGQQSIRWRGVGELGASWWGNIKRAAERKNLEFDVTKEQAWDLFLKQNRICGLTGEKLEFTEIGTAYGGNGGTASMDRIDSSRGYTLDNIWWVHRDVNIIKLDWPVDEFFYWCYLSVYKDESKYEYSDASKLKHYKSRRGYKLISGRQWSSVLRHARQRGIQVNITIEQAMDTFSKQGGRCAITGLPLVMDAMNRDVKKGIITASLDRLDSNKPYDLDNIQWVHKHLNMMKWHLPNERFIEVLNKVYWYNKEKITDELTGNYKQRWRDGQF